MSQINWLTSFAEGLARAAETRKPVFADFFNPG
jgi:hypothetical protein